MNQTFIIDELVINHNIVGNSTDSKLPSILQILGTWQLDKETYRDIVNTKFLTGLSEKKVVVPDLSSSMPEPKLEILDAPIRNNSFLLGGN